MKIIYFIMSERFIKYSRISGRSSGQARGQAAVKFQKVQFSKTQK